MRRRSAALAACVALTLSAFGLAPAAADGRPGGKQATATGSGGAVSTVDPDASAAALSVLRRGGNAVDAAVAAAATLGVTEPFSAGIGGGGYFVYYDAKSGEVSTLDGRETAPLALTQQDFIDPATGERYPFSPELVTSGVAVGVPGTPATWQRALDEWGTLSLRKALQPAITTAKRGFVVDETFREQTLDNKERFAAFDSSAQLFLPGGDAPRVGDTMKNHDLADTYRTLAEDGVEEFYSGELAEEISETVQAPPVSADTDLPVPPGEMTMEDLAAYEVLEQEPTKVSYRGLDVYGMAPSSSGGTTVGEALNILDEFTLSRMSAADAQHHYLEASALAYADRGRYVGDPAFVDVPIAALTDPVFGAERACLLDPGAAASKPLDPGEVSDYDGRCPSSTSEWEEREDTENVSTTHLTTADKWGNVVSYTLTIEQTGGSGITVPGRGFLLNNELTDFTTDADDPADPNRVEPGKRPRSSMAPTIVLRDGEPMLALGSPGGSTIITTTLQTLLNRVDLGMSLPEAIAAPRASQRNTAAVTAEPEYIDAYADELEALGHTLVPSGDSFTPNAEIGAVAAIEINPDGTMTAAAEPRRRGGGSALVLTPER
ncbi:gamma-glutamyltranspeptidase/glutathione hydrolase [Brevibacterium sanguinis]|uniref:Glutathione hydrolase proenzyme n=2 Tax=Brevibacterium TaxID=1696 RepID=A0A366IEL6_9MICO|nr:MULTISPECIES: gamma-glutamyltransferase [Brevibacterium]RBP63092.1 gamma-glutamyltranspeptidase/glutathione hydrolase [Brevibacterium sanguinis]RBP69732.1 gamma-glutamyltranspeptidase/glutathione hydrolase [Brevibacterium celere]